MSDLARSRTDRDVDLDRRLQELATPLRGPEGLEPIFRGLGRARFVLLGEASHGTHEFYTWRTAITRRLVEEHGFSAVAVEGDWPDCQRVNRWIRDPEARGHARDVLREYARWPTWMWANREVVALVESLRRVAQGPPRRDVAFYGLDVYSLWESLERIAAHLREHRPEAVRAAVDAVACFDAAGHDLQSYAARARWLDRSCEREVVDLLAAVRRSGGAATEDDRFDLEQNALVIRSAEQYYRTALRGGPDSWNLRDGHMADTLDRIAAYHGPGARVVVWAHNSHVGDARFTDMEESGLHNLGQLVRERHGEDAVLAVGFGTRHGTVLAAPSWDAPGRTMRIPPARPGSWEDTLDRALGADAVLTLRGEEHPDLHEPRGHRAIGVVYDPRREAGNYVPTVLPRRYDLFVHLDRTRALRPLHAVHGGEDEAPETWPTGL